MFCNFDMKLIKFLHYFRETQIQKLIKSELVNMVLDFYNILLLEISEREGSFKVSRFFL